MNSVNVLDIVDFDRESALVVPLVHCLASFVVGVGRLFVFTRLGFLVILLRGVGEVLAKILLATTLFVKISIVVIKVDTLESRGQVWIFDCEFASRILEIDVALHTSSILRLLLSDALVVAWLVQDELSHLSPSRDGDGVVSLRQ